MMAVVELPGIMTAKEQQKLMEKNEPNWGFDAQKEVYCDMVQAGIIDPTKVVRTALQDAASIAGLLITTGATVAPAPAPEEEPA